jgi:hypothetical protein
MEPLAIIIFFGFPLVGLVVGLAAAVGVLCEGRRALVPESHYIAARVRAAPVKPEDARWIAELEALGLAYRHTIC